MTHTPPILPVRGWRTAAYGHIVRWRYGYAVLFSMLVTVSSSFPIVVPRGVPYPDKWAHIVAYLALGIVYINAATVGWQRATFLRILGGWAAVVLYQQFVPGRVMDPTDVVADAIGGGVAVLGSLVLRLRLALETPQA
jgi:VanZ family protein